MIAQISVFRPAPDLKIVQRYTVEYYDRHELLDCFEEARQVWDEYLIMLVDANDYLMISPITYMAEIMESVDLSVNL
jgi:hypothetical protein